MIASPLRYPGGKAKLYPFFRELIVLNKLYCAEYCEPYAGGAGLALRLLSMGFVKSVSLNDIDRSIYAFWHSALRRTDDFCEMLERTPITIEEWHRQRAIWTSPGEIDLLRLGFAAYFLNRTNRSGIIEGAGPIGGYAQAGEWKIDVRLVKSRQVENLKALAQISDQIEISNIDAADYIKGKVRSIDALLYLDPPYYVKGHKLYKNFYERKDHQAIAAFMEKHRRAKWVVSYDDVPEIRDIYRAFPAISYSLSYSAGAKGTGKEVIFLSDDLASPTVEGFSAAA